MNAFERLVQEMNAAGNDAMKAYAGNKAAGVRLREYMQVVKALAQEVREEMLKLRG